MIRALNFEFLGLQPHQQWHAPTSCSESQQAAMVEINRAVEYFCRDGPGVHAFPDWDEAVLNTSVGEDGTFNDSFALYAPIHILEASPLSGPAIGGSPSVSHDLDGPARDPRRSALLGQGLQTQALAIIRSTSGSRTARTG